MSVSPRQGAMRRGPVAAVSSRRSAVVPTGMTRRPAAIVGGDGVGGLGADLAPFGVHAVQRDVVDLDRQEGAGADVERQPGAGDPPGLEGREERRVEVERRGRGRHRARTRGEDGLVVVAVGGVGRAAGRDVGRQRHLADRLERRLERRSLAVEGEQDLGAVLGADLGGERAEGDAVADRQPLAGPGQRPPGAAGGERDQRRLDARLGAGGAAADAGEPRRDHPRVVEDQEVARLQPVAESRYG